MSSKLFGLISALILCLPLTTVADPLGTIPSVEETTIRLSFDGRSDLWISPLADKPSPVRIYNLKAAVPVKLGGLYGVGRAGVESVSVGRTDLLVGKDRVPLGSDLRVQSIGGGLLINKGDETLSLYGAHTSASDEPFQIKRDTWGEIFGQYSSSEDGPIQWVVSANYSKNRGYLNNKVLPVIGVIYRPNDDWKLTIGFPFFEALWAPQVDWRLLISATPVGARAETHYIYTDSLAFFTRAGIDTRSYLHTNRTEEKNRLIYEEKYVEFGFKRILSPQTFIGMKGGTSFDRFLYESESVFSSKGPRIELTSDVTGGLFLEFIL